MPNPLSPEENRRRLEAWRDALDAGHEPGNGAKAAAARACGLKPSTFQEWTRPYPQGPHAVLEEEPDDGPPEIAAPEAMVETHDAAFHRRRARTLEAQLAEAQAVIRELGGLREVPIGDRPVAPFPMQPAGHGVLIVHTSDVHLGEVIDAGELKGVNEFNPDIAERRMMRLFHAANEIGERWTQDVKTDGVLLTMCGDLISGDIHEELQRTNALQSFDQVKRCCEIYNAGIRLLVEKWGRVHVVAVPGNHGRITRKPTAKLYAQLSYDIAITDRLREKWEGDARVTWQYGRTDEEVVLYARKLLVTHGDKIGAGGGQGFAGPVLPIIRGTSKARLQQASMGEDLDLVLMGHFHTSAAPPGVLANGSVPGYSEYGRDLRARFEPPKQWIALYTSRWGLRERMDVQLETRPKARVRAGIRMRAA